MKTNKDINGYSLSRQWFNFCFENPEKIKPNHTALYFFIIEHCNRLGWKSKFGLPTAMAKEAIGIRSYNTYINTLNDLVKFGFIVMVEKSKNQYTANIVALSNFDKAQYKALDEAIVKNEVCSIKKSESTVQSTIQSTGESISSIDKQINQEPLTVENQINIISLNANGSNNPKNPVGYLGTQNNPEEPKKPDNDNDIKEKVNKKENEFKETIKPFVRKYGKDICNNFYLYWTEPNKSKTKLRYEMEKTWDVKRRLANWANRDKTFNAKSNVTEPNYQKL